jgi:hypothetical protein
MRAVLLLDASSRIDYLGAAFGFPAKFAVKLGDTQFRLFAVLEANLANFNMLISKQMSLMKSLVDEV